MASRRKRHWPQIDLYQKGGTGSIRVVSAANLESLMNAAVAMRWSAEGRPEWFRQHRDQFHGATLVVFGREGAATYRCIATVIFADGSGGRFTLDVAESEYAKLEDLDYQATVIMAHRYLATFPPVDLDEAQAQTWDENAWKSWGAG